MNYFEDWYSQPNDVNEQDREKLLASMLAAAAADVPTSGLQNDPQVNSGLASDPSDFINRIVENNTIPQLVNKGIADINSWFEDQPDLPTRDRSVYDFLRKPEEPLDDLGFFDRTVPAQPFRDMAGSTDPDRDIGNEQPGISQLLNEIQYDQVAQMNSAEDIAQQQANLDTAQSDYQSAVDGAYYDSQEKAAQPDGSGQEYGSDQATQDSKKLDTPDPDKPEHRLKQRFLDGLMARGYSQEDALRAWEEVRSGTPESISAVISGLKAGMTLEEANRFADFRPRMQSDSEVMAAAMGIASALQAVRGALQYALSRAATAEAAGEGALAALWKRAANAIKTIRGGGTAAEGEAGVASGEQGGWRLGNHHSPENWANQMEKRGWTPQQIDKALTNGEAFPARNYVNPGNPATRYVNPDTGRSVVIDNVTKEILHVGEDNFKY